MDFKEFIDGLKGLIKQAEEVEPTKENSKETEPVTDEKETDKKVSTKEPVIEKECKTDEEPVIEKAEEDKIEEPMENEPSIKELMDRITALENKIDEIYKEEVNDNDDKTTEETIAPKIVKSEKELNIREPVKVSNYYEMTNRDPVTGKKIRK